jgi:hypothetical protein
MFCFCLLCGWLVWCLWLGSWFWVWGVGWGGWFIGILSDVGLLEKGNGKRGGKFFGESDWCMEERKLGWDGMDY